MSGKNRIVNTKFWSDSYIQTLTDRQKLLFLYLITNELTNIAGIYEITLKRMSFDTTIEESEIKEILTKFAADQKIFFIKDHIILINAIKHQKKNPSILKGIHQILTELPAEVQQFLKSLQDNDLKQTAHRLSQTDDSLHTKSDIFNIIQLNSNSNLIQSNVQKHTQSKINLDDVLSFAKESQIDEKIAADFFHFYESQDWHTSSANPVPITNWKSKLKQWHLNHDKRQINDADKKKPSHVNQEQGKKFNVIS